MLTFIVRCKNDSLLIIDEPDIYLHSDLQRQLVGLLKSIPSDVLLATHSTEIMSESDPGDLLVINKKTQSPKRIKVPLQLQSVFTALVFELEPNADAVSQGQAGTLCGRHGFSDFGRIRAQAQQAGCCESH